MTFTKPIPKDVIQRKLSEGIAFGKKVQDAIPEVERILNSAWSGVKDKPAITLAVADRWVALESLQTYNYSLAMVQLVWRRDPEAAVEAQEVKYSRILTKEFADSLAQTVIGSQFKCEVMQNDKGVINGFRLTETKSGIEIDVARKSIVESLLANADNLSYALFSAARPELLQLLRNSDDLEGTMPMAADGKTSSYKGSKTYNELLHTIIKVSAFIATELGRSEGAEVFNSMLEELKGSLNRIAEIYPERVEEILEKAVGLGDGSTFDRLLVTKCALYIILAGGDLDTGFRRIESLRRQGVTGVDVAILNPAMDGDRKAVLDAIDYTTARIEIDSFVSREGFDIKGNYAKLKEYMERSLGSHGSLES